MDKQQIINNTVNFVKDTLSNAEGGHDWWHVYRVWKLSINIGKKENADLFVVELGALLHDIADSKFYGGDEGIGPRKAREYLSSFSVNESIINHIENIISNISFKGINHVQNFKSLELDIVQDADRLDALGAIGIARAFNYGGYANRSLYDPFIKPNLNMSKEEYQNSKGSTINHFYEKLLLLKDKMNTDAGKALALDRHIFMEHFLSKFYEEFDGDK